MIDGIYNRGVLDLAGNVGRLGRLADADASATAQSKLCGSIVTVDLKLADGRVADYAQDVHACALGTASAAVMAKVIVGSTPAELRALRDTMRKMLTDNGPPPEGRFAELAVLEPVREYKARHASTLLVFDAVVEALDRIAAAARPEAAAVR
ncbi:MAG: iron-sulfur cluster assembly scaffold protein [Bauldia sp.]|nr:iron-sulfur cluster assembly scaffold protein [Bauldia sp.]MCW5718722.1 iron-sulfur cluster assembly scaffold protein [Bauldia sp.]